MAANSGDQHVGNGRMGYRRDRRRRCVALSGLLTQYGHRTQGDALRLSPRRSALGWSVSPFQGFWWILDTSWQFDSFLLPLKDCRENARGDYVRVSSSRPGASDSGAVRFTDFAYGVELAHTEPVIPAPVNGRSGPERLTMPYHEATR